MSNKYIAIIAFLTQSRLAPRCYIHAFSIPRLENQIGRHHSKNIIDPQQRRHLSSSSLYGLDFDAIENDQECELFTPLSYEQDIIEILISSADGVVMFEDEKEEELTKSLNEANDRLKRKTFQIASCREDLPQPNPEVTPEDLVELCMTYLQYNDLACENSGLEVCFSFSSDRCRASNGGSMENFVRYANNPTFQSMVGALDWKILNVGTEISGTPTRGAMKTILVDVSPYKEKKHRRFLWTMQKERRPPRQNCWLVHECIYVENSYSQTI